MFYHFFKLWFRGAARILFLLLVFQISPAVQGGDISDPGGTVNGKKAENAGYSPRDVYYLGRAVAANIISRYRPYKQNGELGAYLNKICSALIVNSPVKGPVMYNGYHVQVLNSDEINAFASPGGHIFITRGLVGCAPSEDALAAVIAHEIAHVQLEHAISLLTDKDIALMLELDQVARQSRQSAAQIRPVPKNLDALQESVQAMADALFTSGYSQRQEFEADIYAVSLLDAAGYRSSALVDLLRTLQQRQVEPGASFYRTHPMPSQRINNVQGRIGGRSADTGAFRKNRFREISR
jgi:predicted Zn-dependent protease